MNTRILSGGLSYFGSLIKAQTRSIPLYVNIFYTRRCNLRCDFCAAIKNPAESALSLDQWKECSDILYSLGNRFISITGGEPLIRRDLAQFINYLSRRSRLHSVITNARLLTEDRLAELAEAGLMHLGVSTQSLIPGRHVKSQNKELFDLLIKYKKKYHFEVSAMVTITNNNVSEVPEITRILGGRGINVAPNIVTSGQGNWWFRNDCPNLQFHRQSDFSKLKKTIAYLGKSKYVTYSKSYLGNLFRYARGEKPFVCEAGSAYLSINDDGYVMPCQEFAPTKIHYTKLPALYPLKKPNCNDCMWPCYYEETYKKKHLLGFAINTARRILDI